MTDDTTLADGAALLDAMNRAEFDRARAKITTAPLDLTDGDLAVLKKYGGDQIEGEAWNAQRLAVLALVPPSPAPQTKAIKTRPAPPETREEFLQRYGTKPVIYKALYDTFDMLLEHMGAMNAKNIERNTRLDALENRVLELEAQRAAASKVDV